MGSAELSTGLAIPVINIAGYLNGDSKKISQIAAELRAACISPGFFQVTGHSVSENIQKTLLMQLDAFYNLPAEIKDSLRRSKSPCNRGYERVGEQTLEEGFLDQKEGFTIGLELPEAKRYLQGPNQWPATEVCPGFQLAFNEYFEALKALSKSMFRLMALSLELDEKYFDAFCSDKDTIAVCRGHRYPPTTIENAGKSRGVGAHTDFGALTLLLQDDKGGLEVFHKSTQSWYPVPPIDGAYVVNIGDMMERWTNNRYTSTLHRVITPVSDSPRFSVAFFNEGLLDQEIKCIPTCLEPGQVPLYKPVTVEEHLRARYGSSYKEDSKEN